jgi:hypothetical protein
MGFESMLCSCNEQSTFTCDIRLGYTGGAIRSPDAAGLHRPMPRLTPASQNRMHCPGSAFEVGHVDSGWPRDQDKGKPPTKDGFPCAIARPTSVS